MVSVLAFISGVIRGGVVFDGADGILGGDEDGEYKRDRGQQSVHRILRFRV